LTGETETVGAHDGAVLQNDVIAELAILADHGVSVSEETVPDDCVRIDHDVRQDDGVVADRNLGTDDGVSADVGVASNGRGRIDDRGGMDAGWIRGRLVEELDEPGEGKVWVSDAESCRGDLREVGLYEHCRCAGGVGEGGVLRVRDEGDLAGNGLFDSSDPGDGLMGVATKLCTEMLGDIGKRHGAGHRASKRRGGGNRQGAHGNDCSGEPISLGARWWGCS